MRIRVDHRTTYTYSQPASGVVQALRLAPRNHDGQFVRDWRVDASVNGTMRESSDAFGNRVTIFYADAPATELTVSVIGEAEVTDMAGLIAAAEPLPPAVYLRSTGLSAADPAIVALARESDTGAPLPALHKLMATLHGGMAFDATETNVTTPAASAFASGRGVCQDFAHIFCAAARVMGIPARYISGHLARADEPSQDAAHAWAEAYVADLGWVAFDPANGISATDAYLRVAVGLDYLDAAPVRGARRGGGEETMHVNVRAESAMRQSQS